MRRVGNQTIQPSGLLSRNPPGCPTMVTAPTQQAGQDMAGPGWDRLTQQLLTHKAGWAASGCYFRNYQASRSLHWHVTRARGGSSAPNPYPT